MNYKAKIDNQFIVLLGMSILIILITQLSGCSLKPENPTSVTINIANPYAVAQKPNVNSVGGQQAPIAEIYPYIGQLKLNITGMGVTNAIINEEFNGNSLQLDPNDGSFVITDTSFTLIVPDTVDLSFVVTAYNIDNVRIYSGESILKVADMALPDVSLSISLKSDIDPNVPTLASDIACPADVDSDSICDQYESLFLNAAGIADVDGDGILNSPDTDADGDGIADIDEGVSLANGGFPSFIMPNQAPAGVSKTITIAQDSSGNTFDVAVIDPDMGDTHTLSIAAQASNGTASIVNGQVVFLPSTGFSGQDSFILKMTDQGGLSAESEILVSVMPTISNSAPVAANSTLGTNDLATVTGSLAASDPDGDALIYSIVDPAEHGTVTMLDPIAGEYSYTPFPGNLELNMSDDFSFIVSDGLLSSTPAYVSINDEVVPISAIEITHDVDKAVKLAWNGVAAASYYKIYWNTTGNVSLTDNVIINNGATDYVHTNLDANGTTYYYAITSVKEKKPKKDGTIPIKESELSPEFSFIPQQQISSIIFPDGNLAACVNGLGLTYTYELTSLSCPSSSITDLTGIEELGYLSSLNINENLITDISALSHLINLEILLLDYNGFNDITPLSGLTKLKVLYLSSNSITDLTGLTSLNNLNTLHVNQLMATSYVPLSSLSNLKILKAQGNAISDITWLSPLSNLSDLSLKSNSIADLTSLGGLTGLQYLNLNSNSINGVADLSALGALQSLYLRHNSIVDVAPLASLINLSVLDLANNIITMNVSNLSGLQSASVIDLRSNGAYGCEHITALTAALPITTSVLYDSSICP